MVVPNKSQVRHRLEGAYVMMEEVDAPMPRVEQPGDKICVPPTDISNMGCFTLIQDPKRRRCH
jgi:predicted enzyme related to lactoylglutathione lyase